MRTSASGRAAIKQREGVVLHAYLDSVGVWTIGVGHTSMAGPPKVTPGMKISAAEADEILSRDLLIFEKAVSNAVRVPLNQGEFDALVSLAFNIGAGAFAKSTLVRKLNAGDRKGAADQFLVWNKGTVKGKKVAIKGLTTRRNSERLQFLSGKPASAPGSSPAPQQPTKPQSAPAAKPALPIEPGVHKLPPDNSKLPAKNVFLAWLLDIITGLASLLSRKDR